MRVDIEDVQLILAFKRAINRESLSSLEFYANNQRIEIDPIMIDEWVFSGLTNVCFVEHTLLSSEFEEI